ncbi:MAG: amino acid transporter [Vicinamibacteria bacterium]
MLNPAMNASGESDALESQSFRANRGRDGRWLGDWLLRRRDAKDHQPATAPWWQVMCLTGVDYFSTLGYQPGIAIAAAGVLAPFATLVLVLVTLCVALPVYAQVARYSPHGQGSILMLEELLPRWRGKVLVLVLLGFAFTSFIITITLSASDATAHIVENPFAPESWHSHPVLITGLLVLALGGVFLKGFKEAIGVAVAIVGLYLGLNVILIIRSLAEMVARPETLTAFETALWASHPSVLSVLGASLFVFPKLALGLSGFETGVAVMPLVKGDPTDAPERPAGRIRNTRKMLAAAAIIMSVCLVLSSVVTTTLIPAPLLDRGGPAEDRALAYLAHEFLGHGFGTLYDFSTIAILWFAGASALAGLLNLVPAYLPPYGMAPEWARATRPLVLVFTLLALIVTWAFDADVEAQGGAYATGVLTLMTSAAIAVAIARRSDSLRWVYRAMAAVFVYTTAVNIGEQPSGIQIASLFVIGIVGASIMSRAMRSTELRVGTVHLSPMAEEFIASLGENPVRIIAHRPDKHTADEYGRKETQAREDHSLNSGEPVMFLEIMQGDASAFEEDLEIRGARIGVHRILRATSPAVPNAIAATLLEAQKRTGQIAHAYFGWTEGNPIAYVLRYIFLGEGDTAPVTREVLRRAVHKQEERPRVHVG